MAGDEVGDGAAGEAEGAADGGENSREHPALAVLNRPAAARHVLQHHSRAGTAV